MVLRVGWWLGGPHRLSDKCGASMASPCFGEAHRIFVAQIFRNSTQTQIFLFIFFFCVTSLAFGRLQLHIDFLFSSLLKL